MSQRNSTSVKPFSTVTFTHCWPCIFHPPPPKKSLLRLNVHTSLCFYRSLSVRLFLGKLLQFPHLQQRLKPCKLLGLNSFLFLNKYNHSLKFSFLYLFLKFGEFKHLRVIKKSENGGNLQVATTCFQNYIHYSYITFHDNKKHWIGETWTQTKLINPQFWTRDSVQSLVYKVITICSLIQEHFMTDFTVMQQPRKIWNETEVFKILSKAP